jgi:hypothetical protein
VGRRCGPQAGSKFIYAYRIRRCPNHYARKAFARFPVIIPAGATIISRNLRYYCNYRASVDARNFMANVFNWTGVASAHTLTSPTTKIAFSSPMANATEGAYNEINSSNVVEAPLGNGDLKLRFHVAGAAPAGLNTIEVGTQGNAIRMQHIVTYTA